MKPQSIPLAAYLAQKLLPRKLTSGTQDCPDCGRTISRNKPRCANCELVLHPAK